MATIVRVLTVNVGSSSLKLSVFDDDVLDHQQELFAPIGQIKDQDLQSVVDDYAPLDAIGHRIVHGGSELIAPVLIDALVRQRLDALVDLAPLHLPNSLAGVDVLTRLLPHVPEIACFDTAFHAGMPPEASTYALPAEWRQRWNLRRYGFHGLSHSYAAARTEELCGLPIGTLRIVTCHLGAGASLAAVDCGKSVDTTMGFTPLEGLVMATRSGSVDPGLVLWLEEHVGLPPSELASALERHSGLQALAGESDMNAVLKAESAGDERAHLAVEVYLHRLRAEIASMAASLEGLEALTFTGGVGEHAAPIRARAAAGLGFLGVAIDDEANEAAVPDVEVTGRGAVVRCFVIAAREDLQIARDVRGVLQHMSGSGST